MLIAHQPIQPCLASAWRSETKCWLDTVCNYFVPVVCRCFFVDVDISVVVIFSRVGKCDKNYVPADVAHGNEIPGTH